jgi:hypothetical protein
MKNSVTWLDAKSCKAKKNKNNNNNNNKQKKVQKCVK